MKLLLDTHTVAWWVAGSNELSPKARNAIGDVDSVVHLSAVSAYEMAFKHRAGKWPEADLLVASTEQLFQLGFEQLPLTFAHAAAAGRLPVEHRDPFDRMLAAQALTEGLTLVSSDGKLDLFGVSRLW